MGAIPPGNYFYIAGSAYALRKCSLTKILQTKYLFIKKQQLMSKKFLSLGLLIASALTVTGLAASGYLSLPLMALTAKTEVVGTVDPTSTTPKKNGTVYTSQKLNTATFKYPGISGENAFITIQRGAGDIVITKDGEPYQTISASDEANVKTQSTYPNVLQIFFKPITEPGVYEITLPDAICVAKGSSGTGSLGQDDSGTGTGTEPEEIPDEYSAPFTLTFTVVKDFDYTVYPAPGGTVMIDALANATITFPEATSITVNEGPKACLSGNNGVVTYYDVTVEGNVVHLTAQNPENIKPLTGNIQIFANYNTIELRKGLLTISDGTTSFTSNLMEFSPYQPALFDANSIIVSPTNDGTEISGTDLGEITFTFPAPLDFKNAYTKVGSSAGTLYYTGSANGEKASGYMFKSYTIKSLSDDGRVLTVQPGNDNNQNYKGDFEKMESGYYRFQMYSILKDANGNNAPVFYFKPFNVKGAQGQCVNQYSLYSGTSSAGSNVNVTSSDKGVSEIRLAYAIKVKPNPDCKEQIFIYKGDKVLRGIDPSSLGTTSATTVKVPLNMTITDPGEYSIVIPDKAFIQDQYDTTYTVADSFTFYIAEDLTSEIEFNPEGFETAAIAKTDDWNEYPEGFKDFIIYYPEGYTLSGEPDASQIKFGTGLSDSNASGVEFEDNMLIVSFEEPLMATGAYSLTIPAGLYTVTNPDGVSVPNLQLKRFYNAHYPVEGSIYHQTIIPGEPTEDEDAEVVDTYIFDPLANQVLETGKGLDTIVYIGYQVFYKGSNPTATLYQVKDNATGEDDYTGEGTEVTNRVKIADYTAKFGVAGDGRDKQMRVTWTTSTDLSNVEGDLEFVISEGAMCTTSSVTASNACFNPEYTYRLRVNPILQQCLSYIVPEESDEENPVNPAMTISGNGLNILFFGVNPPEGRLNGDLAQNWEATGKINLWYSADGWDYDVIATVPSVPDPMTGQGMQPVGEGTSQMMLMFNENEGEDVPEAFTKPGYYMVEVPEGAFTVTDAEGNVTNMLGFELEYVLGEPKPVDFAYTLDPSPTADSTVGGEVTLTSLSEITISFPNALNASYPSTQNPNCQPFAYLTTPEGEKIKSGSTPAIDGAALTYTFADPEAGWSDGWYTFEIPANSIYVDYNQFRLDDLEDLGNFQGLYTIYLLGKPLSKVDIWGLESADSYNIFTVDGKVVKLDGAVEDLAGLENGLYIINGKKVLVRR